MEREREERARERASEGEIERARKREREMEREEDRGRERERERENVILRLTKNYLALAKAKNSIKTTILESQRQLLSKLCLRLKKTIKKTKQVLFLGCFEAQQELFLTLKRNSF